MRAPTILALLESKEIGKVVDAVDTAAASLRERDFDDEEVSVVNDRLIDLATHPKWEVRRAVAHALRYVRHDEVDGVLGKLVSDSQTWVAQAAAKTHAQRMERVLLGILPIALDDRMQRLLDDVEAKHHKKARDAAIRVGLAYTEFMIRALYHQATAAMMPVGAALETVHEHLDHGNADGARESVRTARAHLQQVTKVLAHARDFVKREPAEYRPTNLAQVVARALATVQSLPIARAHSLAPEIAVDESLSLEASESLLEEALVNVMKNAVEASSDRRPIPLHVRARRIKGRVEITIRDEGRGMTEEEQERDIWRPYGSAKPGGTGLGLPLVKKIVEFEHHGTVRVASKRGVGTTVTFSLPAQQEF